MASKGEEIAQRYNIIGQDGYGKPLARAIDEAIEEARRCLSGCDSSGTLVSGAVACREPAVLCESHGGHDSCAVDVMQARREARREALREAREVVEAQPVVTHHQRWILEEIIKKIDALLSPLTRSG